jgi:chromate transport protein ChrA
MKAVAPGDSESAARSAARGSFLEVLGVFLKLGLTSFGGPIAHLGYFRAEFVEHRRWLTESNFVDLVGLAQFLPGPASSQTGFGIGLLRGGLLGGLAAWTGFTLPSAILMVLFAYGAGSIGDFSLGSGLLHGLKLVAVAIVAQAVLGMARTLCPDRVRASIATVALVVILVAHWAILQLGVTKPPQMIQRLPSGSQQTASNHLTTDTRRQHRRSGRDGERIMRIEAERSEEPNSSTGRRSAALRPAPRFAIPALFAEHHHCRRTLQWDRAAAVA